LPVISEADSGGDVENVVLRFLSSSGGASTSELVKVVMKTACCSVAEAENIIHSMASRGLIKFSGGKWSVGRR